MEGSSWRRAQDGMNQMGGVGRGYNTGSVCTNKYVSYVHHYIYTIMYTPLYIYSHFIVVRKVSS